MCGPPPPPPTTPSVHYAANGKSPLHQQGAVAYGSNGEVVVPTLESMANGANGGEMYGHGHGYGGSSGMLALALPPQKEPMKSSALQRKISGGSALFLKTQLDSTQLNSRTLLLIHVFFSLPPLLTYSSTIFTHSCLYSLTLFFLYSLTHLTTHT